MPLRDFQVLMLTCLVCVNEERIEGLLLGWIHTRVPFGALELLLRYQTKEKVWWIKGKGLVVISINNSDWSHLKRIDRGATFWLRCPGCCLRFSVSCCCCATYSRTDNSARQVLHQILRLFRSWSNALPGNIVHITPVYFYQRLYTQ